MSLFVFLPPEIPPSKLVLYLFPGEFGDCFQHAPSQDLIQSDLRVFFCSGTAKMGSVGAERRRPTPVQTPEERDVWRDGGRAGWRDAGREGWMEGRESGVVQSYSFDSYQLEEEEISKDAPERGVLALSEPGEEFLSSLCPATKTTVNLSFSSIAVCAKSKQDVRSWGTSTHTAGSLMKF